MKPEQARNVDIGDNVGIRQQHRRVGEKPFAAFEAATGIQKLAFLGYQ